MSTPDPIYNVRITIVDLVPAPNELIAITRLTAALQKAGFDLFDDDGHEPDAFESEPLDPGLEAEIRHVWRGGWMRSPAELAREGQLGRW